MTDGNDRFRKSYVFIITRLTPVRFASRVWGGGGGRVNIAASLVTDVTKSIFLFDTKYLGNELKNAFRAFSVFGA